MTLLRGRPERQALARIALLSAVTLLGGCDVLHRGFLGAEGPVAAGERHVFWIVGIVMLFVIGPVVVLTPVFAWHYRQSNAHHAFRPTWNFSWPLEALIWIPPTLIVAGLAVLLWHAARTFDPYTPVRHPGARLEVQAIAFDWKWLVIYPQSGVASINDLVIPVGRPVHIRLTSATVMRSLFIPVLAGQIYAMGGMTTQLNLAADRPGVFLGENTQFDGTGFARERFQVSSLPAPQFEHWITGLRTSGAMLDETTLEGLFTPSVEPKPVYFSKASPGLFQHILTGVRSGAPVSGEPAR